MRAYSASRERLVFAALLCFLFLASFAARANPLPGGRSLLDALADVPDSSLTELRARGLVERAPGAGDVWKLTGASVPHAQETRAVGAFIRENGGSALVLGRLPEVSDVPGIDAVLFDGRGRATYNVSVKTFIEQRDRPLRALSFARRIEGAAKGLARAYEDVQLRTRFRQCGLDDARIDGLIRFLGLSESAPRPAIILIDASSLRSFGAVVRSELESGMSGVFLRAMLPEGPSFDRVPLDGYFASLRGEHRPVAQVVLFTAGATIDFNGERVVTAAPLRTGGPWYSREQALGPRAEPRRSCTAFQAAP